MTRPEGAPSLPVAPPGVPGRWLACLLAVALSPVGRPAEAVPLERDFILRAWRTEHGLPDNRVFSLLADRQGFLWAGTREGFCRFDGTRFVTWSRSTHEAFVSEECGALAEDREGVIWVGTPNGILKLGRELVRFTPVNLEGLSPAPPAGSRNVIWGLLVTDPGEVLVATGSGLLSRRPWESRLRAESSPWFGLGAVTALAGARTGAVWAGTPEQLLRRLDPEAAWTTELPESAPANTQFVHALAVTSDGGVYAIVGKTGRLLQRDDTGWNPVLERPLENHSQPLFLAADRSGGLWFPLTGQVVGCWREGRLHEYALPTWMGEDVFRGLVEDAEGNLWAGTSRNGLVCLQPRRVRTLTSNDGLPDPKTWTLLEASDGALWVGTDGGALRLRGTERRTFTQASGLASDKIRALTEDAQGRVWIGTGVGLSLWDGQSLEPVVYHGADYRTKIRALHTGRDGAVWVGTAQGLYCFRPDQTNAWLVADGLPHENVCAVLEDHQRRVWIGTDGGGLARLTNTGFERFDETRGLSSRRVWALCEDDDGTLWIGTDRGLNLQRDDRLSVITTVQGLPDNEVNAIVADRQGGLWIGHDRGIYRVRREDLVAVADGLRPQARCLSYLEADGLLNSEVNGQISYPPAIRRRDGTVAFATMGGVALFDPERLPDLTNGPPAQVEVLRANGQPLFSGPPGRGPLSEVRTAAKPLPIAPRQRGFIEIQYTAIAFRAPDAVHFRHRLLGLSSDWVEANTLRQASYVNLLPGDYTFEVSAINAHGYASTVPARLAFHLEPFWHERGTVRWGGGLLLAVTVLAGVRWRLRELQRTSDLQRQAALGRERARLAKDLHDGLGANLTEITLLSGLGDPRSLPPETLADRFHRLTQSTHDALHALRNLIWVTNPKADSLEMLVSRTCESVERTCAAAGLQLRVDFPPDLPAVTVGPDWRRDVLLAMNEAIHNVVRHAQARQVELVIAIETGALQLTLRDDGHGFDPAEIAARRVAGDRGLGLPSLRERLSAHGGICEIRSQVGQGTEVIFRVPLPK